MRLSRNRTIGLLSFFVLLAAIPITIAVLQRPQEIRQRAATPTTQLDKNTPPFFPSRMAKISQQATNVAVATTSTSSMWWGVAADSGPNFYLSGFTYNNETYTRVIEALNKNTNQIVWTQSSGAAAPNLLNSAQGLATDSQYLYVAGYEPAGSDGDIQAFVEKYDKMNGSSIWHTTYNASSRQDSFFRVAVYNNKLFVIGIVNGETLPFHADWAIAAYDAGSGALLWDQTEVRLDTHACNSPQAHCTCPPDGICGYDNEPNDVYVDGTGVYVAGFFNVANPSASDEMSVSKYSLDGNLMNKYTRSGGSAFGIDGDDSYIYVGGTQNTVANGYNAFQTSIEKITKSTMQGVGHVLPAYNNIFNMPWDLQKVGNSILVGGLGANISTSPPPNFSSYWSLYKYDIPSLTPDLSFGNGGTMTFYNDGHTNNQVHSLASDDMGNVFIAGCTKSTTDGGVAGCTVLGGSDEQATWQKITISVSPTPTLLPSNTPTPEPSLSPTTSPPLSSLSFDFKLQGINTHEADKTVDVEIKQGSTLIKSDTVTVTSDTSGVYSGIINDITPGSNYDIFIKEPTHLQKKFSNVTLVSGTNTQDFSSSPLPAGDVVAPNNTINIQDVSVIKGQFNHTVTSSNSIADLNNDGQINIQDVSLVKGNFGKIGD